MNNVELAKSNLKQAEEHLKHAREALDSGSGRAFFERRSKVGRDRAT